MRRAVDASSTTTVSRFDLAGRLAHHRLWLWQGSTGWRRR